MTFPKRNSNIFLSKIAKKTRTCRQLLLNMHMPKIAYYNLAKVGNILRVINPAN